MRAWMSPLLVSCCVLWGCPQDPLPSDSPPNVPPAYDTSGVTFPDAGPGASDSVSSPDLGPFGSDVAQAAETQISNPPVGGAACVLGEPSDFVSCCDQAPARCVPADKVEAGLQGLFNTCDDGSICVAESLFTKSGAYLNKSCTSILGADGACSTKCSPSMAGFLDILPQDVCNEGELCAPCISPLDGEETGACNEFVCTGEYGNAQVEPDPDPPKNQASCENLPEEPLVDVNMFPTCCDGARCLPENLVGAELAKDLDSCPGGVCVPEKFVAYAGFFKPETCAAPGGEGRCLSTCLPSVAANADNLPQDICADNELCSPCCDPITGDNTGACDVQCDTFTADGGVCEVAFELCCSGAGHCLPEEIIPEADLESLDGKGCSVGERCVPDEQTDPDFVPLTCENTLVIPFIGEYPYEGVCLSKCLKIPLDFLIWSGTCPGTHDCVPCTDPLTGEATGAPGC